jgi:predicted DNA-binding transcriptional regulator AlpA
MINLSVEDLLDLISNCVSEQLKHINGEPKKLQSANSESELLTREEVKDILKVSNPTLWKYNKDGILKIKLKIGRRVYYSREDLFNLINNAA